MSKVSNAITMLELLSNNRKYSLKELANTLEVSKRMIRSYKQSLEEAGIYIDTIKGPYGGYILNYDPKIPKRSFSKYDVLLLKQTLNELNNNKSFLFKKEYQILIDKIDNEYKSSKKKLPNYILEQSDYRSKYNIFSKAIKEKRKVKIVFLSIEKGATERVIHPCNLFIYNNDWYVSAFCELRAEIRHFSLSRILNAELLDSSYKI